MFENYDKENMFESIWNFSNNLKEAIVLGDGIDLKNDYSHINNIVIAGMGGSAIGGDIVSVLENSNIKIPYTVCRDYSIDHRKQKAIFSFFRSTFDKPIFQIEKKNNGKSKLLFDFSITYKQKIIETNVSLSKILKRLEKKFKFFQKNKKG